MQEEERDGVGDVGGLVAAAGKKRLAGRALHDPRIPPLLVEARLAGVLLGAGREEVDQILRVAGEAGVGHVFLVEGEQLVDVREDVLLGADVERDAVRVLRGAGGDGALEREVRRAGEAGEVHGDLAEAVLRAGGQAHVEREDLRGGIVGEVLDRGVVVEPVVFPDLVHRRDPEEVGVPDLVGEEALEGVAHAVRAAEDELRAGAARDHGVHGVGEARLAALRPDAGEAALRLALEGRRDARGAVGPVVDEDRVGGVARGGVLEDRPADLVRDAAGVEVDVVAVGLGHDLQGLAGLRLPARGDRTEARGDRLGVLGVGAVHVVERAGPARAHHRADVLRGDLEVVAVRVGEDGGRAREAADAAGAVGEHERVVDAVHGAVEVRVAVVVAGGDVAHGLVEQQVAARVLAVVGRARVRIAVEERPGRAEVAERHVVADHAERRGLVELDARERGRVRGGVARRPERDVHDRVRLRGGGGHGENDQGEQARHGDEASG